MSVGHVARTFEEAGIPTVAIFIRAFRRRAEQIKPPRTLITRHPLGRTLGAPGDVEGQRRVLAAALDLLQSATAGGTLLELPEPYRPAGAP
ncbi:MAG: hypothetical protein ACE5HV_02805 [Acidobacteriota bacterium]